MTGRPLTDSERTSLDADMASIIAKLPAPGTHVPVRPRRHALGFAIAAGIYGAALILAWCGQARGHNWYPASCCSGRDCKPVDDPREVGESGDSYTYQGLRILKSQTQPSQDERYHVCIVAAPFGGRTLRCLFKPTPGS